MFILYCIWGEVLAQSIMLEDWIYAVCSGHVKTTSWLDLIPEVDHSLFGQLVQRAQLLLFTAERPQFFPINPL